MANDTILSFINLNVLMPYLNLFVSGSAWEGAGEEGWEGSAWEGAAGDRHAGHEGGGEEARGRGRAQGRG